MEDIFINKIHINKVRHLENVEILLSDIERKHLILTGRNGSGKTSVLDQLNLIILDKLIHIKERLKTLPITNINWVNEALIHPLHIRFAGNYNIGRNFLEQYIFCYFPSKRNFNAKNPIGVSKISELKSINDSHSKANTEFIQYLVNLRYELIEAKLNLGNDLSIADKEISAQVIALSEWFDNLKNSLRVIFNDSNLELEYNRKSYNFDIFSNNKVFDLSQLPDGYSAIMDIISELVMRMKNDYHSFAYDLQGIVLIDEIETHLHIDLQKKVLPFLTSFFPKIQFIVTTHSPFVLSSVDNAIIYDLETRQHVEDLSGYSIGAIIESYFDSDTYSDEVKRKVDKYETLLNKETLTEEEKSQKFNLERYFEDLPKTLSPELSLKISQLELAKLAL